MGGKTTQIKQRQSNIELLRILTMLGVIVLHYNNPIIGKGLEYAQGFNYIFLSFMESLCICAVNIFMLISGYFMCKSSTRNLIKPLSLIIEVIFFSIAQYVVSVLFGSTIFSWGDLFKSLIPNNYFVILYITVYFLHPYLNWLFVEKTEKQKKEMLFILIGLFSVWPTIVDLFSEITGTQWNGLSSIGLYGSQWGYSIVNFILLYIVGAYFRFKKDEDKESIQKLLIYILFCTILLTGWSEINDFTGYFTEKSAWEYCNPIMILQASLIFRLFKKFNLKYNKIINRLAKACFTVFLLQNFLLGKMNISYYVTKEFIVMIVHMVITLIVIYFICWVSFEIYNLLTTPIYGIARKKIEILEKKF